MNTFEHVLREAFIKEDLLYTVLSQPTSKAMSCLKMTIRPIRIKNQLYYHVSYFEKEKSLHKNLSSQEVLEVILDNLKDNFCQALICTREKDYHLMISKKGKKTLLTKPPSRNTLTLQHDHQKNYILPSDTPIPFLIELGVMSPEGKILAKKSDKFRQINRFLEMIKDIVPYLEAQQKISIVDFGCGKAYLTFALYYYLVEIKHLKIDIVGIDLKSEVVKHCQEIAEKLKYIHLSFTQGNIEEYTPSGTVDLVISLHACDTATDLALEKAIRWQSKVILAVPCCQHELYQQIKNQSLNPLLSHGILKERFAALATDAARGQLLEILGYQTQILEFIDMEHTPKNLLIRAVKRTSKKDVQDAIRAYRLFKENLNIRPTLEQKFLVELREQGLIYS